MLEEDGVILFGDDLKITRLESDGVTVSDDFIFYRYETDAWVEMLRVTA